MRWEEAQRKVHAVLEEYLGEGEIPVTWILAVEVATTTGRYLAHRGGGGADGTENPMSWHVVGMARATQMSAEDQQREGTVEREDDEPDEPDG